MYQVASSWSLLFGLHPAYKVFFLSNTMTLSFKNKRHPSLGMGSLRTNFDGPSPNIYSAYRLLLSTDIKTLTLKILRHLPLIIVMKCLKLSLQFILYFAYNVRTDRRCHTIQVLSLSGIEKSSRIGMNHKIVKETGCDDSCSK